MSIKTTNLVSANYTFLYSFSLEYQRILELCLKALTLVISRLSKQLILF